LKNQTGNLFGYNALPKKKKKKKGGASRPNTQKVQDSLKRKHLFRGGPKKNPKKKGDSSDERLEDCLRKGADALGQEGSLQG